MRPRLATALAAMVLVPLGLLAWLGAWLVASQERLVRQSFEELALAQLQDVRGVVQGAVEERERRLLGAPELLGADGAEPLRAFVRRSPLVRAVLVLDPEGRLLHPPPRGPRTRQEDDFLLRAKPLLEDRSALTSPAAPPDLEGAAATRRKAAVPAARPGHGWYVWYQASDLALLFWQRAPDGRVVGVEIDRDRLLADLIGRLPEGGGLDGRGERAQAAYALLDARGELLYRWGPYRPEAGENPVARLGLAPPLGAWQLVVFAPQASLGGEGVRRSGWLALGLGLLALALALGGLAALLHREHTRGLRLAEQRVSFVNQVSHELKTPLTNIRMYAELLEARLEAEAGEDGGDAEARRYLGVVVTEGQRLSRLIDNVLTFGRQQRGALRLRLAQVAPDEVVLRAVDGFRPALAERGVAVELGLGAPQAVWLDADALTQIVDNLLSNVEKYGARGGRVQVGTRLEGALLTLTVADQGPGIPAGDRERVFAPFERLADGVTEGAAGTGIGLAIVRELARLHGGDARVAPSERGAAFEVTLQGRLLP